MPTNDSTTRLLKAVAATALLLAGGWLVAPGLSHWYSAKLAHRLVEQIAVAEDSAVKVPLRQLAHLGDPAIEPLVVAAASERATVSNIAQQILNEKMAAWELATQASTPANIDDRFVFFAATLARSLATHIEEFGPAGKQWAERLTLAMIAMADALPARQSGTLLAHCSQILAGVPPQGPRMRTLTPLLGKHLPTSPLGFLAPQPQLEALTRASEASLDNQADIEPRANLKFRGRLTQVLPPSRKAAGTEVLPHSSGLNWSPQGAGNSGSPASLDLEPQPLAGEGSTTGLSAAAVKNVLDVPTPQEMSKLADDLRQLSTEVLLHRLRRGNFYETGIIRVVLGERGFAEAELLLMQRLSSPEVAARLRIVDSVSALPAAAARRVLRWLLEDGSAEVRLRALTALATTNAPDLKVFARELARNDEDPRVSELATRLLRQVR